MCGIAGIVRFDGGVVDMDCIRALTGFVRHRGPDAQGVWRGAGQSVALGHARLSILDLSEAAGQPMTSDSGRCVIVYNGEIYNFLEISDELRAKGYSFRTQSDTEVILNAYDAWGEGMLDRFNGMWAFAVFDTERRELLLSRDRFGVKPLYYYADCRLLVFASEVQAIHRLIPDRVTPNREFLAAVCAYDNSVYGTDMTYLSEVRQVLPGFNVRVRQGSVDSRQWYWLRTVDVPRRFGDQALRLRELAFDACRVRLRSDVPVATCLSGGIDSGSIVSILSEVGSPENERFSKFSHRSFTAAFPGSSLDETADARNLAQSKGMDFDLKVIECPGPEEVERSMRACDGPMPAMAFFPIWQLYEHIKSRGVSVTLDGQGVDEMLGGYYLGYPALRGAWQMGSLVWLHDLYRTYGGLHADAPRWIRNDLGYLCANVRASLDQSLKQPVKRLLAMASLYRMKPSKLPRDLAPPVWVHPEAPGRENALAIALWRQFFHAPLPFLLHQYDRCSMASGVECRMPFMDYRLVEYVFSLPLQSRVGHGVTKRVLREAMKGILPESTRRNRIKTGFNAPFRKWVAGSLGEWVRDVVRSPDFRDNPLFDGETLGADVLRTLDTAPETLNERVVWSKLHLAWWSREVRSFGRCPAMASP